MIDKFAISCMTTYYKAKAKLDKLSKADKEMYFVEQAIDFIGTL